MPNTLILPFALLSGLGVVLLDGLLTEFRKESIRFQVSVWIVCVLAFGSAGLIAYHSTSCS